MRNFHAFVLFFFIWISKNLVYAYEALSVIGLVESARPYIVNITIPTISGVHKFHDLRQSHIFSDDATFMFDGENTPLPDISAYTKFNSREEVVAIIDKSFQLKSLVLNDRYSGAKKRFKSNGSGYFDEIVENDDEDKSGELFVFERYKQRLRAVVDNIKSSVGLSSSHEYDEPARSAGCFSATRKEFQMAFIFDSGLCKAQTKNGVIENMVEVLSATQPSFVEFCGDLKIKYLEGYCDAKIDPYIDVVASGTSGCGKPFGIFPAFAAFMKDERWPNLQAAFALLAHSTYMSASDTPGSGQHSGCAQVGGLCEQGNAIAHFDYSNNIWAQRNNLVHEIGHIFGARHVEGCTSGSSWMCLKVNDTKEKEWGSSSLDSISQKIVKNYGNNKICPS